MKLSNTTKQLEDTKMTKVRRNHPQRKYRVALKYFLCKRGDFQFIDDEKAAELVAAKFGVNAKTLMRDFKR